MKIHWQRMLLLLLAMLCITTIAYGALSFSVVGTGQTACYDDYRAIAPPRPGQAFYGQDAQHPGVRPVYRDNGDGTVSDLIPG